MKLNLFTLTVIVVMLAFFGIEASHAHLTPAHAAGLAIAIPSIILFILARLQLGSAFSVEARASTLVTTGIYSKIRNPIYVFGALMFLGIIVWNARPLLLLIYVVILPMQIYRSRKEEQVLTEKFGDAYLAYKRKTWF